MKRDYWTVAFGACAAIVGAGFASGREVATFFARFGAVSWLGVALACAGVGYLTYALLTLMARTGARDFAGMAGALFGAGCARAARLVYAALLIVVSAAMLAAGGELAALTLPFAGARAIGLALTLAVGLYTAWRGPECLARAGALLVPAVAVYFVLMARSDAAAEPLRGAAAWRSAPLGLLYAAFNGALSAGAICAAGSDSRVADGGAAARAGIATGAMLFCMLAPANLALLRAGEEVLALPMPAVALAARWGLGGYYASAAVLYLAVESTLAASLSALANQYAIGKRKALAAGGALAPVLSAYGFAGLVSAVYPALGWVCALALVGLTAYMPGRENTKEGRAWRSFFRDAQSPGFGRRSESRRSSSAKAGR